MELFRGLSVKAGEYGVDVFLLVFRARQLRAVEQSVFCVHVALRLRLTHIVRLLAEESEYQTMYTFIDELEGDDDLAGALAGQVLETAGLEDFDHLLGDLGDVQLASLRRDDFSRLQNRVGRLLGIGDDGVELIGGRRQVVVANVVGAEYGDLGLRPTIACSGE